MHAVTIWASKHARRKGSSLGQSSSERQGQLLHFSNKHQSPKSHNRRNRGFALWSFCIAFADERFLTSGLPPFPKSKRGWRFGAPRALGGTLLLFFGSAKTARGMRHLDVPPLFLFLSLCRKSEVALRPFFFPQNTLPRLPLGTYYQLLVMATY